ncbi:MAG: DUF1330 domain-containing protein [Alphaproteobacteria bacterium]|nr:DUF1330 domain-containing protein [Alphaproteobacteria bacterium]
MAAYQVAIVKVTNRTPGFMEYVKKSADMLAKYGAEYVVRGPAESVLEGDVFKGVAVVVSKWPSLERAKEFWNSEEYQKNVKPLREASGIFDIGLFPEAPK